MAPAFRAGRIWAWMRLAKSAAWMRLNDMGESSRRFFPLRVVAFTIGEEFHSVNTTRYPWLTRHLCSRSSWVLFPDPSIPSTMKRRPGSTVSSGIRGPLVGSDLEPLAEHSSEPPGQRFALQRIEHGSPQDHGLAAVLAQPGRGRVRLQAVLDLVGHCQDGGLAG